MGQFESNPTKRVKIGSLIALPKGVHMDTHAGQGQFNPNAQIERRLNQILEVVQRLQASQTALIATMKHIPAGDGKPMLNPERWTSFQKSFDKEIESLGG
ncbi:MAG: hypothetical protein ABR973_07350 [Candidatus Acidiferrales bacterium]